MILRTAILVTCLSGLLPAEAVRLRSYPQKFRTFYAPDDPRVPAGLRDAGSTAKATDGAIWEGSHPGVIRRQQHGSVWERTQYMAGLRYLPDDDVVGLLPDPAAGMWVRTRTGVSHIELRPMTIAQKAELFEQRIRDRHDRFGLVASSSLEKPGDLPSNRLESSDNDGLWTAIYAAAECFRYSVTGSASALKNARKSTEAVLFLEQITGRAGFPARSYVLKSEPRPTDGVWYDTPDGRYRWKADTSSDEIVGHFFVFSVAYDLLPDTALKTRIAATARRIMDHILEHGYNLVDVTGKPTTWGRWTREYFESEEGKPDSPLNALELLSFLKTAHHITGDARYAAEYKRVALDLGYAAQAGRLAELTHEINYSDEELAMLPFYTVFRYEKDEKMLAYFRRALDSWWLNIQREKNPLWTLIYLTGQAKSGADLAGAVETLYRIPNDLIEWTVKNSGRKDVAPDPKPNRFNEPESLTLLAPDERPIMKWNGSPFHVDGGNGGRSEDDGAFFLLPYWMGRYQGKFKGE